MDYLLQLVVFACKFVIVIVGIFIILSVVAKAAKNIKRAKANEDLYLEVTDLRKNLTKDTTKLVNFCISEEDEKARLKKEKLENKIHNELEKKALKKIEQAYKQNKKEIMAKLEAQVDAVIEDPKFNEAIEAESKLELEQKQAKEKASEKTVASEEQPKETVNSAEQAQENATASAEKVDSEAQVTATENEKDTPTSTEESASKEESKEEKEKKNTLVYDDIAFNLNFDANFEKEDDKTSTLFVVDFDGSVNASEVENLRRIISLIIEVGDKTDEVLLRLTSPGGAVAGYGLCASQLDRLRKAGIKLTVAVDEVAASGGYMMACVGDKILAAPFAYVGSIGVVTEFPNFNRLLKKYDIDYEQLTAGEFKRTMTMLGENTDEAREKMKSELHDIHVLFKNHVAKYRPNIDIDKVATGEFWLASDAIKLGLVDELTTSDDYISAHSKDFANVLKVDYVAPKAKKSLISIGGDSSRLRALFRSLFSKFLRF